VVVVAQDIPTDCRWLLLEHAMTTPTAWCMSLNVGHSELFI